jgi:uncharacterized protein with HEPN domain
VNVWRTSWPRSIGSGATSRTTGRASTPANCCRAVLHWIESIGEAARGVGDKVRTAHPEVPWRVITDTRNRVSHGYFDIDLDVVWNTVTRDLPKLQESVTRILAELDSEAEDSR